MKSLKIGYIGLGKMGMNMVLRLREKGYNVLAYNRSEGPRAEARKAGITVADSIGELVRGLPRPRTIWLMVSNSAVDEVLREVKKYLAKGDTVIDGGNSFYKDSIRRSGELEKKSVDFLDVGVSGGPKGAREGACLMIGGKKNVFEKYKSLFKDLSDFSLSPSRHSYVPRNVGGSRKRRETEVSYAYVGRAGAGHFVKMVHNGIEYGMMQSLAEGFSLLRAAELRGIGADGRGKNVKFGLDLNKIANLYNHRSVIESRLVGWLKDAYEKYGSDLAEVSGSVAHTGEGEWTVSAAKELGVPAPIIEGSFKFRVASAKKPSYTGKVLSALRNQFGGHDIKNEKFKTKK
ncbi:MAG: decarboxylating 6-phosphogluconate dehydrogenase [Candidatus Taylorbacteria bacterium]|nr:decarboxylating 6-phosphogluconate dehydrogenase [Candidatus Taylorbacteria bacterium]